MRRIFSKERDNPNRLILPLSGDLLSITGTQAFDLNVRPYDIFIASIDWYGTELAEPYRTVPVEDIPILKPPGLQTMWPNETQWHILFDPGDVDKFEQLRRHSEDEGLAVEEMGVKALTCHLFSLEAEKKDYHEISEERFGDMRAETGFIRARPRKPPTPDPRDVRY